MKEIYSKRGGVTKTIARDPHDPAKIYHHTHTDERDILSKNAKIRSHKMMRQGSKSPIVEGDVIAYAFQFPTLTDYNMAKAREPDLFDRLHSKSDTERYSAAFKLSVIFPGYVTTTKRGDSRR